ncbi:TPA: hypothetical protein ACXJQL_002271 [Stenotrophomonas maltophilia]
MKNVQYPFLLTAVLLSFVTMLVFWPNYGATGAQLSAYMASAAVALALCLKRLKKILVAERVKAKR